MWRQAISEALHVAVHSVFDVTVKSTVTVVTANIIQFDLLYNAIIFLKNIKETNRGHLNHVSVETISSADYRQSFQSITWQCYGLGNSRYKYQEYQVENMYR